MPDGCIEWIFHLGAPFQRLLPSNQWETQPRSFVVGEMTRFLVLQAIGPLATMGVRFRPGRAYRFLPFPVDVLTDETTTTGDVWGGEGKDIEESVLEARSDFERMHLVEKFLLSRIGSVDSHPWFDAAIAEIMRSRGMVRVEQLAGKINLSSRQLEREFRAKAGLSPKALARIIRFQNLLRLVGESNLREWATLALAGGYADQSHMVREFRDFSGQSPTNRQVAATCDLASNFVSPQRLATLLG